LVVVVVVVEGGGKKRLRRRWRKFVEGDVVVGGIHMRGEGCWLAFMVKEGGRHSLLVVGLG